MVPEYVRLLTRNFVRRSSYNSCLYTIPTSPRIRLQRCPAQIRQAMLIDGVRVIILVYNHGSTSDSVGAGFVPSKLQDRIMFDRVISLRHWIKRTIMRTFIAVCGQGPRFLPNARDTNRDHQSITTHLNLNVGHEYWQGARCV